MATNAQRRPKRPIKGDPEKVYKSACRHLSNDTKNMIVTKEQLANRCGMTYEWFRRNIYSNPVWDDELTARVQINKGVQFTDKLADLFSKTDTMAIIASLKMLSYEAREALGYQKTKVEQVEEKVTKERVMQLKSELTKIFKDNKDLMDIDPSKIKEV